MNREVVVVSPQNETQFEGFCSKLGQGVSKELNYHFLDSLEKLPQFFSENENPYMVAFDFSAKGFSADSFKKVKDYFWGVRRLDRKSVIVLLKDNLPDSEEFIGWLDAGATACLSFDFSADQLQDSLLDMFEEKEISNRASDRFDSRHKVTIRLASLEQAVAAETLNIGLGGMFLRSVPEDVSEGDIVDFSFEISETVSAPVNNVEDSSLVKKMDDLGDSSNGSILTGSARVVWIRQFAELNKPEGMGLAFVSLEDSLKKWLNEYVASRKISAFIPKG